MSCLFSIHSVIMCLLCLSVFCVSLCVSLFVYINVTKYTRYKKRPILLRCYYIYLYYFVHLMMLYFMCFLLYRNSLMQISPLALTNFYQSHIFFFNILRQWTPMLDQVALYFNNIIIHFLYYCSDTCFYNIYFFWF